MPFKLVEPTESVSEGARFFKYAEWDNTLVMITKIYDVDVVEDQFRGPETETATVEIAAIEQSDALETVIIRGAPGIQRKLREKKAEVDAGGQLVGRIMKTKTKRGNDFIVLATGEAGVAAKAEEWYDKNLKGEEDSGGDSSSPWKK